MCKKNQIKNSKIDFNTILNQIRKHVTKKLEF